MRILILQYLQPRIDLKAIKATERSYFVGLMSLFVGSRAGSFFLGNDVRFRLHPESNPDEYLKFAAERKLRRLDFDDHDVPLRKSLKWADLVICPASSGAALEAIGAGKRTYLVLLPPHSQDARYFRGAKIFETVDAVRHAFAIGMNPDHSEFFERYTSRKQIPAPAKAIWAVLS